MSHAPQRLEKDCLNCGSIVTGRYCHVCGQENVVPRETFRSMVVHFFYDITHFDSSFFITVRDLLFKPGFLSGEYMKGRRKSYLHPIRMYLFTSAFFFLLFFSFFLPPGIIKTTVDDPITPEQREKLITDLEKEWQEDTTAGKIALQLELLKDTGRSVRMSDLWRVSGSDPGISVNGRRYHSRREYDSLQRLLPVAERDSWIRKRVMLKVTELNEKYRGDPQKAFKELGDQLLHKLPYLLLVSLPFFAGLLKLAYCRRKSFFYADHIVFTIHFYIFSFILLLAVFITDKLRDITHRSVFDYIKAALIIGLFIYLYKAMRNFYRQGRLKTLIKFSAVILFSLLMMLILLVFFFFFSVFTL